MFIEWLLNSRCSLGHLCVSFIFCKALAEAAQAARLGLHPSLQPLLGRQAAMEPFSKRVGSAVKRPGSTIKETEELPLKPAQTWIWWSCFFLSSHRSYLILHIRTCESHRPGLKAAGSDELWWRKCECLSTGVGEMKRGRPAWLWMFSPARKEGGLCLRGMDFLPMVFMRKLLGMPSLWRVSNASTAQCKVNLKCKDNS